MVEEVRNHLKEMLESGTIRPSQSVWCNAMVLVWKKDRGLHFCIDFCHLNLIYCLIYLDDLIVFLQMAEEHLH